MCNFSYYLTLGSPHTGHTQQPQTPAPREARIEAATKVAEVRDGHLRSVADIFPNIIMGRRMFNPENRASGVWCWCLVAGAGHNS